MKPTLYFSYSMFPGTTFDDAPPVNSPYTITYYLGRFLRSKAAEIGYMFEYRNLDDTAPVQFGKQDIALGHTWWSGGFMDAALDADIRAKFIIQPYSHCMVSEPDIPRNRALFANADHLFLITGAYWWDTMPDSPYADWRTRATRLDMAVDSAQHPYSKRTWNKPGKRGFLCMGVDRPAKGLDQVAELARVSGIRLGYFGDPNTPTFDDVPQMTKHGGVNFTPALIQRICETYDFFLCAGVFDANPTTLLETSAWGLIAACTKESGYWPHKPFAELRLNDVVFNWETVEYLQNAPEHELAQISRNVRSHIEDHYTWNKFCSIVWNEVSKWL